MGLLLKGHTVNKGVFIFVQSFLKWMSFLQEKLQAEVEKLKSQVELLQQQLQQSKYVLVLTRTSARLPSILLLTRTSVRLHSITSLFILESNIFVVHFYVGNISLLGGFGLGNGIVTYGTDAAPHTLFASDCMQGDATELRL